MDDVVDTYLLQCERRDSDEERLQLSTTEMPMKRRRLIPGSTSWNR